MKIIAGITGIAAFVAAVAVVGFAVLFSGVVSVAATKPHFPGMRWLLQTGMERSVRHHASDIEAPPLTDDALAHRGFRHFETACAPCHGAPGTSRAQAGQGELPKPPSLSETVPQWTAAELYWIVKHGLKYTGMPAFGPTHREDELWAIVAFLQRLPSLTPADYAAMSDDVDTAPGSGEIIALAGPVGQGALACVRCHGALGAGKGDGAFPRLAGQNEAYLYEALKSYASGARPSGIMAPIARGLTDAQKRDVAAYYAAIEDAPLPEAPEVAALTLQLGGAIAAVGLPNRHLQACNDCHGPSGIGRPPAFPALAGQYSDYLALQLHLWKAGERGGGPGAEIMAEVAAKLTDEEIKAVSLYFASVRPERLVTGQRFGALPATP